MEGIDWRCGGRLAAVIWILLCAAERGGNEQCLATLDFLPILANLMRMPCGGESSTV